MKILLVLTDLCIGGITSAAINLCNELIAHGNRVDVFLMDSNVPENNPFDSSVRVFHFLGLDKYWNLDKKYVKKQRIDKRILLWLLGASKKVFNRFHLWEKIIWGKKQYFTGYDLVIAYRQYAPVLYFALNCIEATKKVSFVHCDVDFMVDKGRSCVKYMLEFNGVAYVSEAVRKGFEKLYPQLEQNSFTVYNFIPSETIKQKALAQCNVNISHDKTVLVTLSRIEDETKGILRIFEVCRNLLQKNGDIFRWYIIGDGPLLEYCKDYTKKLGLQDILFFLGPYSNPFPILHQADISVLPSRTESFAMAVCESLSVDVPVVVCRYPAVNELLQGKPYGIIAEQNVDDLTAKISFLLKERTELSYLKNNAKKYQYNNEYAYDQLMRCINI